MPKGKARKIQTLKTQVVKETVTEEKVTNEETTVKIETVEKEADNTMTSDSQSLKRKHSEDDEPQESGSSSDDTTTKSSGSSSLADRMAKLKELKKRRATEVQTGNRRDLHLEFQRSKENPKLDARDERKRAEALKLQEKQDAEDKGEDYERKQFWKYSAESAEAWEKKMAKKASMANNGFTDHTQAAHKKYIRLMSDFKPDMSGYNQKKLKEIERAIRNGEDPSDISIVANSLDYASVDDKPSQEAIDKLALETKKQIEKRETRSRDRKEQSDDISWINEKNRVFNQKIARFYDKYTKEIRENLERGTAL